MSKLMDAFRAFWIVLNGGTCIVNAKIDLENQRLSTTKNIFLCNGSIYGGKWNWDLND